MNVLDHITALCRPGYRIARATSDVIVIEPVPPVVREGRSLCGTIAVGSEPIDVEKAFAQAKKAIKEAIDGKPAPMAKKPTAKKKTARG